jgi:peptidoglycan/LPS O-acetylase OafA/YrhL
VNDRIPTLDGLRAVAIMIVLVSHVLKGNEQLFVLGHMGVLIFFALSGYLITGKLLAEYQSSGRVSLRDFYLRRAFRILPPALVYLAVLSVLSAVGIAVSSPAVLRSALFFYTNYIDGGPNGWYAGHFWSLSVEEHFYLFWPCLLLVFGVVKGWRTALCMAIAVSVWRVVDSHQHIIADPFLQGYLGRTDLIADTLLWGCCLAFVKPKASATVSTIVAIYCAVLLAVLCEGVRFTLAVPMPLEHILPAVMVGAVIACPTAPIGRLLELAPLRFIGKISYSLYIWQQLFLFSHMPTLLAIAAAVACAYLSYRFIEQPCIAFGRTVIARRPAARLIATPGV